MKASDIREALKTWFDGQLAPDSWVLDIPIHVGDTTATISPVLTFTLDTADIATLRYEVYFSVRLSNSASRQIPVGLYEGLLATITRNLRKYHANIDPDVLEVSVNQREIGESMPEPISIVEDNDGLGDWVITIQWSIRLTVRIDPEVDDPEAVITRLKAYVYSTALDDFGHNAADAELIIGLENEL